MFEKAKQSAPSILFIDDSDMLFECQDIQSAGLYRYLLTLLDGLESETAGRVCVMMTVMDVATLPPALVRSGRVELWLTMSLPDQAARRAILRRHLTNLPATISTVDGYGWHEDRLLYRRGPETADRGRQGAARLRPGTQLASAARDRILR